MALIGFMGSGKSTLGPLLAECLEVPFCDLDQVIEEREGGAIPDLFKAGGESGFRAAEKAALEVCLESDAMVLACGGGTPCQPGLMDRLLAWGEVIYLEVPFEELQKRGLADRPLWSEGASQLLEKRRGVYERAPIRLDGTLPPEQLVQAAVNCLEFRR